MYNPLSTEQNMQFSSLLDVWSLENKVRSNIILVVWVGEWSIFAFEIRYHDITGLALTN